MNRQIPEKEYPNDKTSIRNTFEAGQSHVFRWWNEITSAEKNHLLEQLATIDFQLIHTLFNKYLQKTGNTLHGTISPPRIIPIPRSASEKETEQTAKEKGEACLQRGEIAVLTVAGGQGTRLGTDKPKGILPIAPITGKSLFHLHAEKIHAVQKKYHICLPWYIMTSNTNDLVTQEFFQSQQFFGLNPEQILFFTQRMLPVIDLNGKLLMDTKSSIVMSPNGHGGTLIALKENNVLKNMQQRDIKHIFYHQVDNILIKIADPVFIGYHVMHHSEMSSKVVKKNNPEEKVGIIVNLEGHLHLVEYTELNEKDKHAKNADGTLTYNAGNIAVHLFRTDFLEKIYSCSEPLSYHTAIKKVPYINEHGDPIAPEENNAIKFESFIFDVLKYAKKGIVMEALREEEFSPVKNPEGENSPATAKQDMINMFGRWLRNAGISIPVDSRNNVVGLLEISPCFAMNEEELKKKVDRHLKFDGKLNLT